MRRDGGEKIGVDFLEAAGFLGDLLDIGGDIGVLEGEDIATGIELGGGELEVEEVMGEVREE